MPETNQPNSQPFTRPSVQPMPIQRANYGIPQRQSAPLAPPAPPFRPTPPTVATPRVMDVSSPVPLTQPVVATAAPQPITFTPPAPTPVAPPIAQQIPSSPLAPATRPLFSASPAAPKATPKAKKRATLLHQWPVIILSLGVLLTLGGLGRWATAGNTTGDTIAVAAVKSNDGQTMTIQFTATDGQLHKFSDKSEAALIPGSAVQVAYKPGAPETTVKRVSVIDDHRAMGVHLFGAGIGLLILAALAKFINKLRNKVRAVPLTTSVTV